jgi:uncharacterized protein with FMN-binding domain
MAQTGSSNKKVASSLVAMSSAAVLAVYAAGFVRTKAAAERFAEQSTERRPRQAPARQPEVLEASLKTAPPLPLPVPAEPRTEVQPEVKPVVQPVVQPEVNKDAPAPKAKKVEQSAPVPVASAPAPAPVVAAAPVAPAASTAPISPPPPWKDGTWKGWGTCRHGDLQAAVVVENGKITSATIADCQTRYSCDVIDKLPPEVVKRQSADVDRIGGATQSADAFYYAVYEALRQANEAAKAEGITVPAPQTN